MMQTLTKERQSLGIKKLKIVPPERNIDQSLFEVTVFYSSWPTPAPSMM